MQCSSKNSHTIALSSCIPANNNELHDLHLQHCFSSHCFSHLQYINILSVLLYYFCVNVSPSVFYSHRSSGRFTFCLPVFDRRSECGKLCKRPLPPFLPEPRYRGFSKPTPVQQQTHQIHIERFQCNHDIFQCYRPSNIYGQ